MLRHSAYILLIPFLTSLAAAERAGDVYADTWVGTDVLGRSLPTYAEVGPPRANRQVGLFYFLWVNQGVTNKHNAPVYDNTRLLVENPTHPQYGPVGAFHFWGEPELGYYSIEDPFVLIRHRSMLTAAGIDTLIFDQTNTVIYPNEMQAVCEILDQGRRQGLPVPKIAAMHNTRPEVSVPMLYQALYEPRKYQELWFTWLGKPLLLSPPENLTNDMKDYFTVRHTWAHTDNPKGWFGDGHDKWTWVDWIPQQPGWHEAPDKPEEISVCLAPHPLNGKGRSTSGGKKLPPLPPGHERPGEGVYADEQWKRALEVDPPFVFVTGWNEWIAQRFLYGKPGRPIWCGYDVMVNRTAPTAKGLAIHRFKDGKWIEVGRARYGVKGPDMELALPRALFGSSSQIRVDFKWADNLQKDDDITEFSLHGDSAPDRLFNYRYDQTITAATIKTWTVEAAKRRMR